MTFKQFLMEYIPPTRAPKIGKRKVKKGKDLSKMSKEEIEKDTEEKLKHQDMFRRDKDYE